MSVRRMVYHKHGFLGFLFIDDYFQISFWSLYTISIDWLIDSCLTSSGQYFSCIQDDNRLNNI
jgi:hypothetical protein